MRIPALLLMMAIAASAGTEVGKTLTQGLKPPAAGVAPIPEKDQADVLDAAAGLLEKHITFREDGTQSAICTASGRQEMEWKQLVTKSIASQKVNEADREAGISQRYLVSLSCDGNRVWDNTKKVWGPWNSPGLGTLPSTITVELAGGKWIARETNPMKKFAPGAVGPVTSLKPDEKSDRPPPGMTRMK